MSVSWVTSGAKCTQISLMASVCVMVDLCADFLLFPFSYWIGKVAWYGGYLDYECCWVMAGSAKVYGIMT